MVFKHGLCGERLIVSHDKERLRQLQIERFTYCLGSLGIHSLAADGGIDLVERQPGCFGELYAG